MILRRFMKHVTDQNWFAVGLDVIVVIVGIFLGLQLTSWNDDREARVQEQIYLEHLRTDIIANIETVKMLIDQRDGTRKKLNEVAYYLSETRPDIALSKEHCRAIGLSYRFGNFARERQALLEIEASGQIANFKSDRIRYLISLYARSIYSLDDLSDRQTTRERLSAKYPEVIKIINNIRRENVVTELSATSAFAGVEYQCNIGAMKESASFHNDLMIIDTLYVAYLRRGTNQLLVMQELLEELDIELGFQANGDFQ